MSNELIQADYDRLKEIAAQFARQGDANQAYKSQLVKAVDDLRSGGWEGRGSEAFLAEIDDQMLPAATRLHEALHEANRVVLMLISLIEQAEEEAAAPFRGGGGGVPGSGQGISTGQPVGGTGGSLPGAGTSTGQPVGGTGGTVPTSSQPYVVQDPRQLFTENYMKNFIGSQFKGAGNPRLNQLMENLLFGDPNNTAEVNRTLDEIAAMRGVDPGEFRQQYARYRELLANANAIGGNEPYIDRDRHGDFMGSTLSLRYGSLVGETFGIDPVFGALLNPTGGLVGPGDTSYWPADNDAIGYHGTFHDAAGYLYNYHNIGPGYDYMNREPFPTGIPLTGQAGGISWWMSQPGLEVDVLPNLVPDVPFVPSFVERGAAEVLDRVEGPLVGGIRIITNTAEGGADIVDGIGDVFSGDFREGFGDIGSGAGTIARGIGQSVLDLFD